MIADPSAVFKTGEVAVSLALENRSTLLTGVEEASLYHDAGQHGFFSLLWCDPTKEPLVERLRQEKRQLKLKLVAVQDPASDHYDPTGSQVKALEAKLSQCPKLTPKVQKSYRLSDMPRVIEALDNPGHFAQAIALLYLGRELGALRELHFQRFGEVTRGIVVIACRVLNGDQLELELPLFLP